jgi:hypothetical protein
MTDLKWLDGYSGQTTDELLALAAEYRTDSLAVAFEEAVQQKGEALGTQNLSTEETVILAVEALEREVNNGGYYQFFCNSSNEFAGVAVSALRRIGCETVAKLTERAITSLGLEGPPTVEAIEAVVHEDNEALEDALGDCDQEYYEVAGDLANPLLKFIKDNRAKIVLPQ